MKVDIDKKYKYLTYVLFVLVIILIVFMTITKISEFRYKKEYRNKVKSLENEKKELIEQSEKKILLLNRDNRLKDEIIKNAYVTIDSLEKVKQQVEIRYIIKYKQIDKFNSEQVKNYWENEFKK